MSLDPGAIRASLPEELRSLAIDVHDEVDSTNRLGRMAALAGAGHGAVIVADHQSAGMGRGGRSWHSPAGVGLFATIVLRSALPARGLAMLPLAVGVGTAGALEKASALTIGLKWPNDLYVSGRKLGGILVESSLRSDRLAWAVAGIGINVSASERDFPPPLRDRATSLALAGAPGVAREALLGLVITGVLDAIAQLEQDATLVLDAFRKRDIMAGRGIVVDRGGQLLRGTARGIGPEGALLVETTEGFFEVFDGTVVSFET